MRRDDPLEDWLLLRAYRSEAELADRQQLELSFASTQFLTALGISPLPDDTRTPVERLHDAYRHVYTLGGPGNTLLQEQLVRAIALAADPVSIPFWVETLRLQRPRDTFATRRRTVALAALAYLAIQCATPAAYIALREATHHDLADVRSLAVHYLGRAHLRARRPLPPDVVAALADIAVQDPAFSPRYQARAVLRTTDLPIPLDNPGGVYIFKVKFMWAKRIFRSLALRSEQTLEDLHVAIQHAIDWDEEHLYSFFMNGDRYDDAYRVRCPYEADADARLLTDAAVIGQLGLVRKHKFLYYFDYGASNEFEIETIDIRPQAEPGVYPRVVERKGEAPPQYDESDDDEDM